MDSLPLLLIAWVCLFPLVICFGGLCDFWGQGSSVVERVCQLLLGKILASLIQKIRDLGGFQILPFHLTDVEPKSQRV